MKVVCGPRYSAWKWVISPGELGEGDACGQNFRAALFEQRLDTSPAGLLAVVCDQGGGVEQEAQGSALGRTLCHQLGYGITVRRELAASTQQTTRALPAVRNHPDEDLFSSLDQLPVKPPANR